MILVWDEDFHQVQGPFEEAYHTHTSTSPNLQLIASLDVARRQMELEGYGLTMQMTELAIRLRQAINSHPVISKYFHVATRGRDGAGEFPTPASRITGRPHSSWAEMLESWDDDEFALDPTRLTIICGSAGFDGTQFKGILAERFDIQLNKTSRNSVLDPDQHQQYAERCRAPDQDARRPQPRAFEAPRTGRQGGPRGVYRPRQIADAGRARPAETISRFHDAFRENPKALSNEGPHAPGVLLSL